MPGTIKAVLFDLDGTLIDTHDLILSSMRYSTQTVLHEQFPDEVLMRGVGTPLDDQLIALAGGDVELGMEVARVYREHNHAAHDAMVDSFPSIPEALQALRDAGLLMGIVTSKREVLARRGLACGKIEQYMNFVVAPDNFPVAKPLPDPVLHGCRLAHLEPSQCIYVGDSPYDIQSGNAAGCPTIAVEWGMFDNALLRAQNPTYWAETPQHMVEICKSLAL